MNTMKALCMTGKRRVEIVDRPVPRAAGEFVVVKVHVAPLCTEYKAFDKGTVWPSFGHEAAGEVAEVAQPGRVKAGDRVVVMPNYPCGKCPLCLSGEYIHCQRNRDAACETGNESGTGTCAQYLLKQDWLLVSIPDGVSYEHAAMACCGLGPTFGAMELMRVDGFDTALVTGLGPVGLGGIINGRYRGARMIGVEPGAYRAGLAKALGAEAVIDPGEPNALERILELTGGAGPGSHASAYFAAGVDKAVDCSGNPAAQRLAINAVRRKGRVAFVGEGGELGIRVSDDMIRKGLTLHGSWHYNLADTPRVMRIIRDSGAQLDRLITHQFPMERAAEAFELQLSGKCGKVLLRPWG